MTKFTYRVKIYETNGTPQGGVCTIDLRDIFEIRLS